MMDDDNGVTNRGKRKGGGKKQSAAREDKRLLLKEETIDIDVSNASWEEARWFTRWSINKLPLPSGHAIAIDSTLSRSS